MAKFKFKTGKHKKSFLRNKPIADEIKKISGAKIEILSNKEMTVDGCKGITEYNDKYVKIKISNGYLVVFGSLFFIPVFDGPLITISGNISSIEFCVR